MKPIKLTMQGFGSYGAEAQTVDFTEPGQNIFLIAGDTGAGKSTIFDAIVFALYGESASAQKNKKGEELQSQFSGFDVTPFVELEFSEREGGRERLYKIRRTPAHRRQKARGSGTTKGEAEVCLTLPDGTVLDRPISSVDEKIADIVKLDKDQFKKVAMLAQGEFMAMLSASSKEKKQIFRGIFNTGIYGAIAQVLTKRRGALKQKLDAAFAEFRAAAAQVVVAKGYGVSGRLQVLADDIAAADALDAVYAEELMETLAQLNGSMRLELERRSAEQEAAAAAYKAAIEALQKGKALARSFEQLRAAEADLERCRAEEASIAGKAELAEKIDAAFDIAGAHTIHARAEEDLERNKARLGQLKAGLPAMSVEAETARGALEEAQKAEQAAAARADALKTAVDSVMGALQDVGLAQKDVTVKQDAFAAAKARYAEARDMFESANTAFLDSQAGYIARELKPGEPCPVCGSLEHPHPHKAEQPGGSDDMTPDMLNKLKAAYDTANEAQVMASADAAHANEGLAAAKDGLQAAVAALDRGFAASAVDILAAVAPLCGQQGSASDGAEVRRTLESAQAAAKTAVGALARAAKEAASAQQEAAKRAADAQTRLEVAMQSIQDIEQALPQVRTQEKETRASFDALVREKGSAGEGWEQTVQAYAKADIKQLRGEVSAFNSLRAKAQGAKEAAEEAIGESPLPDIGKLGAQADAAQAAMDAVYAETTGLTTALQANTRASDGIAAAFGEWQETARAFGTADELCRRLSGAKSGERMDLETFVQRYYFRQILHDANKRLLEMTNNEYEFRMVDQEAAGTGSNKGLDLMVYSSVNDAVRDIRTLSGGESFMAALAFALGLSDQIMAKKSAVNLDIMFIDEGFGSLDDNARKLAVDTLRAMTGDGRMIGIISHVAELKQAIDDQLIVTKDDAGSHAQWCMN